MSRAQEDMAESEAESKAVLGGHETGLCLLTGSCFWHHS